MNFEQIYKSINKKHKTIKVNSKTYIKAIKQWIDGGGEVVNLINKLFDERRKDYTDRALYSKLSQPASFYTYVPVIVDDEIIPFTHEDIMKLTGQQMADMGIKYVGLVEGGFARISVSDINNWFTLESAAKKGIGRRKINKITRAW